MLLKLPSGCSSRPTLPILRTFVGVTCLLLGAPAGYAAPAAFGGERTPLPLMADDGFTRESLAEFDAPPEPPPLKPAPAATGDESQNEARIVVHHHHRLRHQPASVEDHARDVVVKSSHRRNPLESFVYWWNGFVVRNFHTRNGTVLLDTIGAKT